MWEHLSCCIKGEAGCCRLSGGALGVRKTQVSVFSPSPILVGSFSPMFKPPSEPDIMLH